MVPLLHDADVVLVNMAAAPRSGDIVLARTTEGYVVKRLARMSPIGVELESLNPDFDPIIIRDDSRPIVGVVVLRWCEHETNLSTPRIR
jgi:phage repressor protein C with HTH and peptisase S24 domain